MKHLGTRLTNPHPKLTPRRRGETLEKYLERTLGIENAPLYWKTLTEKMYTDNPESVVITIETLRDKNPEACKIVEDTYAKLQGASN